MHKYKIGDIFLYKIGKQDLLRQIIDINPIYYVIEAEDINMHMEILESFIDKEYFKLNSKIIKLLYA